MRRVLFLVDEWQKVHQAQAPRAALNAMERWLLPPLGTMKLNTDGAFPHSGAGGGRRVIVRDHIGNFVAGACQFFPAVSDPESAELLACKRAFELAMELGYERVILETDSKVAEGRLNAPWKDFSVHGPLVEYLKRAMRQFHRCSVRSVRRTANVVAHNLAREGCSNKLRKTWLGNPPECVISALARDLPDVF